MDSFRLFSGNVSTVLDDHSHGSLGNFAGSSPGHAGTGQTVKGHGGELLHQNGVDFGSAHISSNTALFAGLCNGVDNVVCVSSKLVGDDAGLILELGNEQLGSFILSVRREGGQQHALDQVDSERIGILGICGFGGMGLNAAAMDTRIKATVTSTMYDMSRVNANGYFDAMDADARYELRKQLNAQRTQDARTGTIAPAQGGLPDSLQGNEPQFVKDYFNYYKTSRGFHTRSINSNGAWNATSSLSFMNMPLLTYADEIRSAVLIIHGEKAHSRYFSEDAFKKLKGNNKELLIIPGANHTDLYDQTDVIPFDKITDFFRKYLK